jgi:type I restriction enzyme S subunit
MKSNYKKLGDFIQVVSIKNTNLKVTKLLGVSITKKFIPSIANTIGTDMSKYKVVKKNQFTYGSITSRNGDKISVALLEDDEAIVSTSYTVFEVTDTDELLPEYLMMWFRRTEFDRYARYMSHGSTREAFGWDEMCDAELPIPSIEKQKEIVKEYHTITDRIKLNELLNQRLEDAAQNIYKEWFVNFAFPAENGNPYKSNGGEMVYCEELDMEIPRGWEAGTLLDIMEYSKERVLLSELDLNSYISTENMIENRGGVTQASSLPTVKSVSQFNKNNILISNIRPYFKKIWLSEFEGGCSNDILCITSKNESPLFLYFVLEQDIFFDYVMAGSKGTKMPRGDKDWILRYPIVIPNEKHLRDFSKISNSFKTGINIKKESTKSLVKLSNTLLSKMATIEGKR